MKKNMIIREIEKALTESGQTRAWLSRQSGVDYSLLCKFLNGKMGGSTIIRRLDHKKLEHVADAFKKRWELR